MGFSSVYQSLTEIFPQVDARILRAVAIEHPLDADEAAAVVLSDIVPSLPSNSSQNFNQSVNKPFGSISKSEVERGLEDKTFVGRGHNTSASSSSSSSETIPLVVGRGHNTSASSSKLVANRIKLKALPQYAGRRVNHIYAETGSKFSASSSSETIPLVVGRGHNTNVSSTSLVSDWNKLTPLPPYPGHGVYHNDVETGSKSSASSPPDTIPLVVGRGPRLVSDWNKVTRLSPYVGRGVYHNDVETGSKSSASSSSNTIPPVVGLGPRLVSDWNKVTKLSPYVGRGVYHNDVESGSKSSASSSPDAIPLVVGLGHNTDASSTKLVSNMNGLTNLPPYVGLGVCHKDVKSVEVQSLEKAPGKEHGNFDFFGKCFDVPSEATVGLHVPQDDLASVVSAVAQDNVKFGSDFWQDLDHMMNLEESSTSIGSENTVPKLVDLIPADNMTSTQQDSSSEVGTGSTNVVDKTSKGSLASENGDTELGAALISSTQGCSVDHLEEIIEDAKSNKTSKGSLASENGDTELDGASISSTQGCSVDHLEEIIEDAKSNKKTLLTVMDSVMNLMKEVELEENGAEKSMVEAARGGLDTLEKVEELKKMLKHAKEANDMHAGEVYGEKSILSTELRELENRLLNLSEERNKSLSVLDEMRGTLEIRLAAALEMKKAAEEEKKKKEDSALKALAELEAVMEKVAQESKLLQQEAEENSKLREFLMDRGQIVDSLQGEISVICQDVKLLKEKFDNRVSLTESISSQTSSGASFMRTLVLEFPSERVNELLETSSNSKIPEATMNKTPEEEKEDDRRELLEAGWEWEDIFDKETEL